MKRQIRERLSAMFVAKGLESSEKGLERAYLPELDSLRFFAFLLVFGFHKGLPALGGWIRDIFAATIDLPWLLINGSGGFGGPLGRTVDHAFLRNGWIGVNLFFCLSGFIITRLLIQEEDRNGRIDWKAFWIRRALRIWPLYYVIYVIGFVGFPGGGYLSVSRELVDDRAWAHRQRHSERAVVGVRRRTVLSRHTDCPGRAGTSRANRILRRRHRRGDSEAPDAG